MSVGGRRWNGWGLGGERFPVAMAARAWLSERIGDGTPLPMIDKADVTVPAARPLPGLPCELARDRGARLRYACGLSLPDLLALRTGAMAAFPDAVAFPASPAEVAALVHAADATGVALIPRGGGTSVVGGVTVRPLAKPTVVLSLERLRGLLALDCISRLATFAAGTLGPELEAALAPHGLRLGHEPQSFEFSTLGGWIATRSAGQRSTGVGKIDDLLAGLEIATPAGVWRLPAQPASAAGPEPRRLLLGGEGRLGVITEATVRVRPVPELEDGVGVMLPGWEAGVTVCRSLVQGGVPVEVMRLSDPNETAFGTAITRLSSLQRRALRVLGMLTGSEHGCLLLLGWAGGAQEVILARERAAAVWRSRRGVPLGSSPYRHWRRDRFRHPYLRDELLGAGWGVDTVETAAPWAKVSDVRVAVSDALRAAGAAAGFAVAALCHLSHVYRDGASLYFTFLWPLRSGAELTHWHALKAAATDALLAHGGTLSHHHGVGTMHAPYLEREIGAEGVMAVRALVTALDPRGTLNPGVLLSGDGA
jgi:alkyldihydroxyacetonephosphate synthase